MHFSSMFFRKLHLGAECYLVHPPQRHPESPGSTTEESEEDNRQAQLEVFRGCHLNHSQLRNFIAFREVHQGVAPDGLACAIANVTNGVNYSTAVSSRVAPTLVRNSCLVDLVRDSPLTLPEYWAIMGYTHPDLPLLHADICGTPNPFTKHLEEKGEDRFRLSEQKILLGNGMHLASIGSWKLFGIIASTVHDLQGDSYDD